MKSADKLYTSHSIICAEVAGLNSSYAFNSSLSAEHRLKYFLATSEQNKAVAFVEQLFVGFATQSGVMLGGISGTCDSGFLPFIESATDQTNNSLMSRVQYGPALNISDSGTIRTIGHAMPMYGVGFGYDVNNYLVPSNKTVGIQEISNNGGKVAITRPSHFLLSGNIISITASAVSSYNGDVQVIQIVDRNTFIIDKNFDSSSGTMNYPNTGRYYGVNVDPYRPSGAGNPEGYINTINYTDDTQAWKVGPIDLRWDDSRKVWCGSDFFKSDIIRGYLASDITPAGGKFSPTPFRINTYTEANIPYYIASFTLDTSGKTLSGTVVNIADTSLELVAGDPFTINGTNTTYDGSQIAVDAGINTTTGYRQFIIDRRYDSGAAALTNDIGYVSIPGLNLADTPRVIANTYIAMNYDSHLSVDLSSKCLSINSGCVRVEDDIYVIAVRFSPDDIQPIYIGYGE